METHAGELRGRTAETTPTFDERTFDQAYFTQISNYAGRYERYNPPHKIRGYVREVLRWKSGGSLMDVGCAFGKFLLEARRHYRCEGLDISSYALQVARTRLADVPLHHGALQQFRPGRTFDVVTCFDVLEHIPDLDVALASLRRLLAPDGVLVVAVPVYDTLPGRLFGIIDRDPTHVHRFGRQAWLFRLQRAGLRPITYKGALRIPLPGAFAHLLSPMLRWFSSAIVVACARARTTEGASQEGLPQ